MTRILVVDDVLTDQRLAGGILAKLPGCQIAYAGDGQDALAQFDVARPDLVLTDLQMPDMDGLQLVEALRRRSPGTPVILMTGRGSEEIALEALARGAASYVPKRTLVRDLLDVVSRALSEADQAGGDRRLLGHLSEIAYRLDNDPRLISAMVSLCRRAFLATNFLDESDTLRASGAIDEALQNAYFHGNLEVDSKLRERADNAYQRLADERRGRAPYAGRQIRFQLRMVDDEARVTIGDDGPGFDVSSIPDPTHPEFFDRPHGRGVFLMRAFMDRVEFNATGNEVTMVKRRSKHAANATRESAS